MLHASSGPGPWHFIARKAHSVGQTNPAFRCLNTISPHDAAFTLDPCTVVVRVFHPISVTSGLSSYSSFANHQAHEKAEADLELVNHS